ncbi:hypothetical protein H4S06_002097 [Coemansia sp. BCRC 34490]|nr:hypothetical protein LPJ72_000009 [Coemansia sp. Benny D160-2]KAJ2759707.1 hypothetical protein H4S06_002097 [Coemansia sp. BCRC 34490]
MVAGLTKRLPLAAALALTALQSSAQAASVPAGSGLATFNDYQQFPLSTLQYNPPFCGMPYTSLDVTRITAVAGLTLDQCGTCLKVSSAADPSKSTYVLAVDKCVAGLDLSKPAFAKILNIDLGKANVKWEPVDKKLCSGVYPAGGI